MQTEYTAPARELRPSNRIPRSGAPSLAVNPYWGSPKGLEN